MEVSGHIHGPAAFSQYPLDRRLFGSQSRSGRDDKEKKVPSTSLPGMKVSRPARSLITILTEPSRFLI